MNVYACYNIKGGVGKTTTAVNLAYLSSTHRLRTLIWDLDPQGAATFIFRVKPKMSGGVKRLIRGQRDPDAQIRGTDFEDLDILRAHFDYRHLDVMLSDLNRPTDRLARVLSQLSESYDRVFLDCPPGITIGSESVFGAADALLVPTIPTILSLRTLSQLLDHLKANDLTGLRVMPFFSMVDRRKSMQRVISDRPPNGFLSTRIPYLSVIEQMSERRAPLPSYDPNGAASRAYEALREEIEMRVRSTGRKSAGGSG